MKAYINKAAINKTIFSSQAVSMMSYIVHPVKEKGNYLGRIYEGKEVIDEFNLECTEDAENQQLNIDLGSFNFMDLNTRGQHKYTVKKDGYIVLYNSKNDNKYRIKLERMAKSKGSRIAFDTFKLSPGDHFATVLLRPGRYEAKLYKQKSKIHIEVMYPKTRTMTDRRKAMEPVQVRITEKGFSSKKIKLTPGQGLVFPFEKSGAVQINLVKAYEEKIVSRTNHSTKSKKKAKTKKVLKKFHWENPKYKTQSEN